ncbi:uncharacterized protein MELLADRAFT_103257 [Melampsora larici-populina 98AG31]|uniref:Uncharacterized protein n=1 Tax=Melampsora larici-populina (strain 98AG31 / pathotype 3-4-7) TaxID=747676 RepID=F4R9T0_MELLP|nr:uncharacterized protein MELLADRAFT_103257 [Melampsora larici-populina 98AG31]EGG10576.1 hypothetical protein MELLADRAFT_103257 [Melampsora larici-populina 98AG31]
MSSNSGTALSVDSKDEEDDIVTGCGLACVTMEETTKARIMSQFPPQIPYNVSACDTPCSTCKALHWKLEKHSRQWGHQRQAIQRAAKRMYLQQRGVIHFDCRKARQNCCWGWWYLELLYQRLFNTPHWLCAATRCSSKEVCANDYLWKPSRRELALQKPANLPMKIQTLTTIQAFLYHNNPFSNLYKAAEAILEPLQLPCE